LEKEGAVDRVVAGVDAAGSVGGEVGGIMLGRKGRSCVWLWACGCRVGERSVSGWAKKERMGK
jgi:hypothetical protein